MQRLLCLTLLALLPAPAAAQYYDARPAAKPALFDIRIGGNHGIGWRRHQQAPAPQAPQQTDPSILAALARIEALLAAQRAQPITAPAPPIYYFAPPQQQLPINPPQQVLPIQPPQQQLPIQPPQQQLPIQAPQQALPIGQPQQLLLIGGVPHQVVPGAPLPQIAVPQAGGLAPPQQALPVPAPPTPPPMGPAPAAGPPVGYQRLTHAEWVRVLGR